MKKLVAFITLLYTLSFAQTDSLESVSVQLKWFYQYQFAGIIMAKEKGFYEQGGLDVTIKERDPKQNNITQVIDGDSQYGVADAVILRYRAQGHPVKVLSAIFQHNAMVLMSKKESGILGPHEMRGKSVSYQKGLDDSIITSLLTFADLDQGDVIEKPMDFTHMDFVNGGVDVSEAYISIEPYWLKEKYGIEVNVINPRSYGIDLYGDLIFTTEKEIKEHPKRVKAFNKATLQGWEYALEHEEETINTILEKYNTRNLNAGQLQYEARATKRLIAPDYIALGSVKRERFETLAELYHSRGQFEDTLAKALKEIVYVDAPPEPIFKKYLYYVLGIISFLFMGVILLTYYNRHLTHLVRQRTQEIEEEKRKAEAATSAKASFLANMSHEIRTPMNAILGFVEQLAKTEQDEQKKKMFNVIKQSSHNLLTIINDILDLSKIENGKIELEIRSCDIVELFENLESLFHGILKEKNLSYSLAFDSDLPRYVMMDGTRLSQIMINLLSNAIKFTPSEGTIKIAVKYNWQTENLEIFVVDSGIGVAEENIGKIFNAFEQEDSSTTRRFGGTGLGLAISKKLVNMMGGAISVQSKLNEGTTFYILFHSILLGESEGMEEKHSKENVNSGALLGKILVVEDNKTNQMLIGMILEDLGLEFVVANDGKEAVDIFENDASFDLILMDENMPVMNGVEAVKRMREMESAQERQRTPIIAVTANALSEDRQRFLDAGMDDYVAKPYSESIIESTIRKYL